MTAKLKLIPPREHRTPEQSALWAKYDNVGNELRDLSQEIGAVRWALFGLADLITDGDHLRGTIHILDRMQVRLEKMAEEVQL